MSQHPIFCSIVQQLHDGHRFSNDPFFALAEFKDILHQVRKITKRALLKQAPTCIGEKLLLTSTALRAYRNRHLGTLMRCCEAWKPVEDCFDILSFGCIDFQRLSQIFARLTRENLDTRATEVTTLPWTQTEKDIALARCRNSQRAWRNKKPVLTLSALTDEEAIPWRMKMTLVEDSVSIGEPFSKHVRKEQGITIMNRFCDQQAPDGINWTIDQAEFDDLLALKKDSAPGPDGIPYGVYRCAGGLGSKFLYRAYQAVFEGNTIPDCFAESRTVLILMTLEGLFDHLMHFVL